eukprot:8763272-Pyramimonas_sp.AAC.1
MVIVNMRRCAVRNCPVGAQCTPEMQSLFVESVQIAHDLFQTTCDPSMVTHIRPPRWRPTQGDTIWATRVFPDNLMARLRDHRREGLPVLHARITLTCALHLMIEIRDIAD